MPDGSPRAGGTLPISAHVLTLNAGRTLRRALASVRRCAEILVIDGGSTDDTLAIARECGARVIPQGTAPGKRIEDFAAVRNRGLDAATQPWILALDSDEELSEELQQEIASLTRTAVGPAAYRVPRRYVLGNGTIIRHATTYPNERIYFFHRNAATRWMKPVHERIGLRDGIPVRHLKGTSLAPLGTVADYRKKAKLYLRIEKERSRGRGWGHWLRRRVFHTLRSRAFAFLKLLWIWLIPRKGKRLPLEQEMIRFWYGWRLIVETCPLRK